MLLCALALGTVAGCGSSKPVGPLKDTLVTAAPVPGRNTYGIYAVPLAGGKPRLVSDRDFCSLGPRVSDGGTLTYLEAPSQTCRAECADSTPCDEERWRLAPGPDAWRALSIVAPPRGQALAVLHAHGGIRPTPILEIRSGGKTRSVGHALAWPATIRWSPSGTSVAFTRVRADQGPLFSEGTSSDVSSPIALATLDGQVTVLTHPRNRIDTTLGWSADGKLLVFVRETTLDQAVESDQDVYVYDLARHEERLLAKLGKQAVTVVLDPFQAEVTLWERPSIHTVISLRTGSRHQSPFTFPQNPNHGFHPITPLLFLSGDRVIVLEEFVDNAESLDLARRDGHIVRRLMRGGSEEDLLSSLVDGSWLSVAGAGR
jgi:dipeptidyl aminopeptidase/acylaminoacyl peptidase